MIEVMISSEPFKSKPCICTDLLHNMTYPHATTLMAPKKENDGFLCSHINFPNYVSRMYAINIDLKMGAINLLMEALTIYLKRHFPRNPPTNQKLEKQT